MAGERPPESARSDHPAGRGRALFLAIAFVGFALMVGFVAGRATVAPASLEADVPTGELVITVGEQSVGRSLNLNVTAEQPRRSLGVNNLTGVVTRATPSVRARQGSTLYVVAGTPVRAVQGRVPFYRDLSIGTVGPDVAQLRAALVTMGLLSTPGDTYDTSTYYAVTEWQEQLGVTETGIILLGEIVAVPRLPGQIVVDTTVATVGGTLGGGEKVVYGAQGTPQFSLVVSPEQARLIPQDATLSMKYAGQRWRGSVGKSRETENGDTSFRVVSSGRAAICGQDCGLLPPGRKTSILAEIAVVASAAGPAVPVAAIMTAANGTTNVQVLGDDGAPESQEVTVLSSQDGMAVVEGVQVGDEVMVFAAQATAS